MKKFLATLILGCSCIFAGAFPDMPAVEGPVNDYAGLFNHAQLLELQHMLVDFADSTSNQICVVTITDLEGMSVSDYAIKLGLTWKVGSDDFNNGIVFLVKPKIGDSYGEAFIAVGRGLEGAIPDITCHRIVNDIAIPYFRNDDYYGGIKAACFKIMSLADEEYHSPYSNGDEEIEVLLDCLLAMLVFLFIILVIVKRKRHNNDDWDGKGGKRSSSTRPFIFISPGNGGTSFGGGSFGGGGFSGGFSGGFGGGSFGGGGGGGRW